MKYCAGLVAALAIAGAALAIAPPQDPNIIPSPPTQPTNPIGPIGPPVNPPTPEPSTLTIALVSAAAVGSFRLLRRK